MGQMPNGDLAPKSPKLWKTDPSPYATPSVTSAQSSGMSPVSVRM